jgi:hypothetical protein
MNAPNDNNATGGLREWWTSPPRSGLRRIIAPWEYRHLRGFARLRIASSIVLACLGLITLSFGGADSKTYLWTALWLALAAAQLTHALWDLSIARSQWTET